MKAWMDIEGFIHVSAVNEVEKFAIRWNRENLQSADANGIVIHEEEPAMITVAAADKDQLEMLKKERLTMSPMFSYEDKRK